ncbi:MAG: mobilization protein [Betaproteobacteria bacterium]|nr:mobilization protein [Betaproteobacteria bacterium]
MSNLHFIGGEKGGVGKSLVSRILAQYCIDHGLPFIGFDSDKSHGALTRFYTDYAAPVVVDDYKSLDRIVETAVASPGERVIVDLAAQTHQPLVRWLEDSGVLDICGGLGLTLTYWHVMDAGRDSVDLLQRLLDHFGARLNLVVVLNAIRGDQFTILNDSGQRERAEQLGARVITLGHLSDATMQKIDARSTSFWAAVNHTEGNLGLLERQRVKVWLNRAYEQIASVAP